MHEHVRTAVEGANYTALYIRYTVPTSAQLHETVALVSPNQPLADAFRFVAAASRPPTQLARWGGGPLAAYPVRPPAEFDEHFVRRRNQLRGEAAAKATMCVFDMLPETEQGKGKAKADDTQEVEETESPAGEGGDDPAGGEGENPEGGGAGDSAAQGQGQGKDENRAPTAASSATDDVSRP